MEKLFDVMVYIGEYRYIYIYFYLYLYIYFYLYLYIDLYLYLSRKTPTCPTTVAGSGAAAGC